MSDLAQLPPDVRALLDRAHGGRGRVRDAVAAAVAAALPDADERGRALVAAAFRTACTRFEQAIGVDMPDVAGRLAAAGTLRAEGLADELLARVRLDRLATALPFDAGSDPASPSLLVRLAHSSDARVAQAAAGLLAAESRREGDGGAGIDLPDTIHAMLAWRIAAAAPHTGRDVADAAMRTIERHDGDASSERAAMRLVQLIDARADELPTLIGEALSDRRLALLAALLAHALGWPFEMAREVLIDPLDARLGLALRALDLPRDTIARTLVLLGDGDPAIADHDIAEMVATLMRLPVAIAATTIAPLALPAPYRAARAVLAGSAR